MKKLIVLALLAPALAQAECTFSVPSLGSMRYNAFDAVDQVMLMKGTLSCTEPTTLRIQASKGSSNNYATRTFTFGSNHLNYNLYLDTTSTYVWGDRTAGTTEKSVYAANGDTQITANVRIPAGQNPPVGYYSDTIVFTVIF